MTQKNFTPDVPTAQTLAGINIEMQGKKDLAVRPARIASRRAGMSDTEQPVEDRLAGINVSMGEGSGEGNKPS